MAHLQYYNYEGYGTMANRDYHYSQAVRVGDFIEIAGQGGWDPKTTKMLDKSDIMGQLELTFANVDHTLKDAGGTGWDQVFKMRTYHVGLDPAIVAPKVVELLRKWCPNHQPTWTMLGIEKLGIEEMNVEIEVTAHAPLSKK